MNCSLRQLLLCSAAVLLLPMCSKHHDTTYSLTIVASGSGTTDPAAGTYRYKAGEAVTVTATPASGAVFTGWSGAATGTDGTVTVAMDSDLTLTASFAGPYGVTVNTVPGLSSDFMMGADVSMLAQIEVSGGKFYDEDGTEKDCLRILKDHGMNWVRLRLWNNPVLAHGFTPETGIDVLAGESAAGINDLTRDIGLAKRAKALGMKVLLDFHYSDWWADPGKQFVPQAWEGMTLEQVKAALYTFTKDAVSQMQAQGAGPDMVQLGNEVTNGMLWPLGEVDNHDPTTFGDFVALLGEGSKAVREVDPKIQIMIHIDKGGDNALYRRFFSALIAGGADFDVIGLSYYPSWHGTMTDLRDNLNDISQYFGKPVVVAETAYPWTTENADAQGNNVPGTEMLTKGPDLPTVQGQTTFIRDLIEIIADVPYGRGLGVFYWEPDWIAVEGAGWYTRGGDGWDNQTFFDHEGKALASLNVFRAVLEDRPWVEATPVSVVAQAVVATPKGTAPTLPTSVNVVFSDDSVRALYVVWEAVDASVWNTGGTHNVAGTIPGTTLTVTLPVTVTYLANPGFESGNTGWTFTTTPTPSEATVEAKDVRSGTLAYHWWNATSFTFTVEQTVNGLQDGKTYSFTVHAMGKSGQPLQVYAYCPPSASTPTTSDFTLTGWTSDPAAWITASVSGLPGSAGSCKVGVTSTTRADDWGSLDDFSFDEQ